MLAGSIIFTLTFAVFGDQFYHSGDYYKVKKDGPAPPTFVLPEALLAEPTVDRMVPFRSPGTGVK